MARARLVVAVLAVLGVAAMVWFVGGTDDPAPLGDAKSTGSPAHVAPESISASRQSTSLAVSAASSSTELPTTLGKAYWDWSRAVVEWLVQRDDPDSLLVAAMIIRSAWYGGDVEPDRDGRSRRAVDFLTRASSRGASNATVQWIALAECRDIGRQGGQCDPDPFGARLRAVDPGNAILELGELDRAVQGREPVQADVLARMAHSERLSQYYALVAALIFDTMDSVRVTVPPSGPGQRLSAPQELALNLITALPQPNLLSLSGACNSAVDKSVLESCRRVTDLMRKSDTYIVQSLGLNIAERISPFGTIQASQVIDARRNLDWVYFQVGRLRITPDQTLRVLPEAGGEVEAWRVLLAENGVAQEPPVDWSRP